MPRKKKKRVSKSYYDKQMRQAANHLDLCVNILKQMEQVKIIKDCSKCQGDGWVYIGNIHGVYGFRLGDNGTKECEKCKGKGYIEK